MYSIQMKRPSKASGALLLGYLAVSTTVPFILSYKETTTHDFSTTKGTISPRCLFNKI